jgi:hypothetical protein
MANRKFVLIALIILIISIWLIAMPILAHDTASSRSASDGDIIYRTDWDWGEAIPTDNGWSVTNDLSFAVIVHKAYLVNYTVQLLDCDDHAHTSLLDGLSPDMAFAGHGDGINSALVEASFVEDLARPAQHEFGRVTVDSLAYCEAHYLIARAGSETRFPRDDIDMYGVSLYIEGTYKNESLDEPVPFATQTHLANGTQLPLHLSDSVTTVHVEVGEEPVEILVQRRLDRLFDGIDFTSTEDIGRAILWNVIGSTEFIVTGGNAH